jgi:hypothetical protein
MTAMGILEPRWSAGLRPGVLEMAICVEPGRRPAFQYFVSAHLAKAS